MMVAMDSFEKKGLEELRLAKVEPKSSLIIISIPIRFVLVQTEASQFASTVTNIGGDH